MSSQASELCKLALTLFESRSWLSMGPGNIFTVSIPKHPHPVAFSLMPHAKNHPILFIFDAPNALEDFCQRITNRVDDAEYESAFLSVERAPRKNIGYPDNAIAEQAGCKASAIPVFAGYDKMTRRVANQPELKLIMEVLRAAVTADKKGMLKPEGGFLEGWAPHLKLGGNKAKPTVRKSRQTYQLVLPISGLETPTSRPSGDDIEGWKEVDLYVTKLLIRAGNLGELAPRGLLEQYFGPRSAKTPQISDMNKEPAMVASSDWLVFDHKGGDGKTVGERILADEKLDAASKELLQARAAARPSIYRVDRVEDPRIYLVDLLTGETVQMTDRMMCMSAGAGLTFCLRVYPVGNQHFGCFAGPAFPSVRTDRAFEFLKQECGVVEKDLIEDPSSLGRLFYWFESLAEIGAKDLLISNADGDRIDAKKASYSVEDSQQLGAALDAHANIEKDEEGYIWLTGPASDSGRSVLGFLDLWAEELLVEVNSLERHEHTKSWLLQQPGVRLKSVTDVQLDPREPDTRPLDDRLPSTETEPVMDAEMLALMQGTITKHYMDWIDHPLPALGGKTPRDVAQTPKGRAEVQRMIRGLTPPHDSPGITVPREEMLRSLGLDDES